MLLQNIQSEEKRLRPKPKQQNNKTMDFNNCLTVLNDFHPKQRGCGQSQRQQKHEKLMFHNYYQYLVGKGPCVRSHLTKTKFTGLHRTSLEITRVYRNVLNLINSIDFQ